MGKPETERRGRHPKGRRRREQGAGIDVGTGLLLTEHRSGLQIDVRMRRLLMHQAEGFEEQGTSISISYNPRPESPLGWIAEVEPGWGSETQGGADRLWSRDKMGGIATGSTPSRNLDGLPDASSPPSDATNGMEPDDGRCVGACSDVLRDEHEIVD